MPVPRFMAKVNRRIFNPMEIRKGERPVLIHTGRSSGRRFETPLDAFPVEDGFVFVVMYGPDTDWVKNVVASGSAEVRIAGEVTQLTAPRLVAAEEVRPILPEKALPPSFLKVDLVLRMDVVPG